MKTLKKLTESQLACLNELNGTDCTEAYTLEAAAEQNDFTILKRDKKGAWHFYLADGQKNNVFAKRDWQFGTKDDAARFAALDGYTVEKELEASIEHTTNARTASPFERTRSAVYATGNRWAIANFNATH